MEVKEGYYVRITYSQEKLLLYKYTNNVLIQLFRSGGESHSDINHIVKGGNLYRDLDVEKVLLIPVSDIATDVDKITDLIESDQILARTILLELFEIKYWG